MGSHAAACLLSLELLSRQEASYCFHPCLSVPISRSNKFVFFFVFIYFWLCWVCCSMGFSLVQGSWGCSLIAMHGPHCSGFSCCRAWAAGHMGLSSCSIVAVPRLESTGSVLGALGLRCSTACGVFSDQGRTLAPVVAGRCFTTEPPGRPHKFIFLRHNPDRVTALLKILNVSLAPSG